MVSIKEFFINASILISIIYVSSFFRKQLLTNASKTMRKVLFILVCILSGWCSMFFGIHLSQSVIFDLRTVPLMICIMSAENMWTIFTVGTSIGLIRFTMGMSKAALAGFGNLFLLGIAGIILFKQLKNKSFIYKTIIVVVTINILNVINIAILGVIPAAAYLSKIVPLALPANIAFSFILVFMVKDLDTEFKNKLDLINFANKDPLTQLYNTRALKHLYSRLLSAQANVPITAAFIDIDCFKTINDKLGHLAGDIALQKVAGILRELSRDNDIVARYGGDEFVILMPDCTREEAFKTTDRVMNYFRNNPIEINSQSVTVTLSIGVASNSRTDIEKLLDTADKAAYIAKNCMKDKVVCID